MTGCAWSLQVRWKQFAIDFDEVPLPPAPEPVLAAEDDLKLALQAMRVEATNKRLDMTDAFEESAPPSHCPASA